MNYSELEHKDYLRDAAADSDCEASFKGLLIGILFSSVVWLCIFGAAKFVGWLFGGGR